MILCVLCSGNLGLSTLIKLQKKYDIAIVATNKDSIDIINFCTYNSIECFVGNPRGGRLRSFIGNKAFDVLISVNYLFLIEEDIINYPKLLAFNIHGSLLPKYRGRTPHVWAIINGEEQCGITAHKISNGCDTGAILLQEVVSIEKTDTGARLLEKYKDLYYPIIQKVIVSLEKGNITEREQNETEATYYGKRTPADGLINWNWQKKRIYNWVRAQSYPYPGAFSFIDGEKVIIDEVAFSDIEWSSKIKNGSLFSYDSEIFVKTSDGALKLIKLRSNKELCIANKTFTNE